ncbi:response regulator transcription factor [Marinihelvus fidelis]|uniref:Response regulator transcription factor n=1 Tax=Marinihelvus fidelis TaxID=2613842 RepID=A0A5N0TGR0_9GAMM|nr:response regulator transcription factor [Marinihelvus fidelis]
MLLIEDNHDIAAMVGDHLETSGYEVDYAADGITGLHLAVTEPFDAIVLDLMLPGLDGMDLCRKFRQEAHRDTPILMLTARDTLEDKVAGLEAGADDYLVKPFEMEELDARLHAMLRRASGEMTSQVLRVANLTVNTGTWEVSRQGQPLTLTPIGLKMLTTLMKVSPRVMSRRDLERAVWGDIVPDSDALRSHLYNLRKVIDKPFDKPLLHTLQGLGYRLADPDDQ